MSKTKKKKKIVWQQYIAIAFSLLIGIACGIIMTIYLDSFSADKPLYEKILLLVGLFIAMYAAMFLHTLVHEAGHLVFGLLTGYKFSSFRIFSFMWLKENGKVKLKRLSIAGTGGQCLMTPPDMKDGKFPFVLYNLGGSFINIIIGALFLVGYFHCTDAPFASTLFLLFAVIGFTVAIMNGVPMRMGTVDNDGYNAFALSRNSEAAEAFWVQMKMVEQTSKGVRLKDMPQEWFAVPPDESMKNSMVAMRGVFACNRLMDEENFEAADDLMEHMLEIDSGMVDLHRNLLICDRMFVELIGENRREVIDTLLSKEQKNFMKAMKNFPSVLRTEYALALLSEKDIAKSEIIRTQFEKFAKTYPYPQDVQSERDLMNIAVAKNSLAS